MIGKCEICYKSISENEERYFCNSCGQDYHQQCIETGTVENNACPMCKSSFFAKWAEAEHNATSTPSDLKKGTRKKNRVASQKKKKLTPEQRKMKQREDGIAVSITLGGILLGIAFNSIIMVLIFTVLLFLVLAINTE